MQHRAYLQALRRHVPTFCLPALEDHPDCAFVEDAAVVVGDVAVVTRMGHASRRGEAASAGEALRRLGAHVLDMGERGDAGQGETPACDGGDILYTGRHLFVGLSGRTNLPGFLFLRDAFAGGGLAADCIVPVPPVFAGRKVLHLKSAVTHLDDRTLLAPEGVLGDAALESMGATERGYRAVRLPDVLSCNAVVVNGHVLAQDAQCEVSRERIERACEERDLGLTFVDTSELAKKDAALTCCSVLLAL